MAAAARDRGLRALAGRRTEDNRHRPVYRRRLPLRPRLAHGAGWSLGWLLLAWLVWAGFSGLLMR